jgi:protein-tyrosine phosphatase
MIDMHSHILYGVDDGAKTIDDSINLIKEEIKKGVKQIILTPHYKKRQGNSNMQVISENFEILKKSVESESLGVQLYLGSEVYLDSNYYETIWNDSFYTLANSDYILIEFSLLDVPNNIPEICYEAGIKGYIPVIAHAERYEILYTNNHLIKDILNEGAHFQVNASAVINKEDKESYKFVNFLLKNELVSFVASDVHNMESRGFYLDEAYRIVKKQYNETYADKIFMKNQENLIMNKYFDNPKFPDGRKGMLSKLFR